MPSPDRTDPARPVQIGFRDNIGVVLGLLTDDRIGTLRDLAVTRPEGALLRLPPHRLLVTTTPTAIRAVLVEHADRFKKGMGQLEARELLGDGLLTAEGADWDQQRRAVAPLLTAKRIRDSYSGIRNLAEQSTAQLTSRAGEVVTLRNLIGQYTLDTLGHVLQFVPPAAPDVVAALDVVQDWAMLDTVTFGLLPKPLMPGRYRRLRRAQAVLTAAAETARAGLDEPPAWATTPGLKSLFLAGYETTASTLSWALYYLSRHPHWQEKLREESVAAGPTTTHLPQAAAVFRETLRLRPPVWLISRKAVAEVTIDGIPLHRGDQVAISLSAIHHEGWKHPTRFDPTRFLGQTNPGRMTPFGSGARACPGGSLAEAEATIWLSLACARSTFAPVTGQTLTPHARLSHSLLGTWQTRLGGADHVAESPHLAARKPTDQASVTRPPSGAVPG